MKSNEQIKLGDLQWKRELEHALEALRKDNSNPLEAAVTFFASVCKLNDGLSWIVPMAPQRDADQVQELFVETIERMRAVMMDITALRDALPRRLVCRDSVVSYAGFHCRSWSGVVLEAVSQLLLLTHSKSPMPLSHLKATQTLDWRSYDSKFVAMQLEIELEFSLQQIEKAALILKGEKGQTIHPKSHVKEHRINHSECFTSVEWYGKEYTFTPNQRAVVKVLWEAMESGSASVSDGTLIDAAGSDAKNLRDIFRSNSKQHPAWGNMIVNVGRDARKLSVANRESHTEGTKSPT